MEIKMERIESRIKNGQNNPQNSPVVNKCSSLVGFINPKYMAYKKSPNIIVCNILKKILFLNSERYQKI